MSSQAEINLQSPVSELSGVRPERASQLARLQCLTIKDLLFLAPRRYEDRRRLGAIKNLALGVPATVRGKIIGLGTNYYRQRTRSVFELIVEDETGRLHCRWWNIPYLKNHYSIGDELLVFGRPNSLKPRTMDHPETETVENGQEESIHLNRIVPVYSLTEGLTQRWLRSLQWRVVENYARWVTDPRPKGMPEELPSRSTALGWLHFPEELAQAELARQRFALEEFLELQLNLQRRWKNLLKNAVGYPCGGNNQWVRPWLAQLGFALTPAQTRVLREIRRDLSGGTPMRRLLQGDVGSGKTVVAGASALMVLESGFNVVLMAPTEILAEQHYRTFQKWFGPLNLPVDLHTGSRKTSRPLATDGPSSGETSDASEGSLQPRLVIGTHALIERGFDLPRLGLVIIDEQHRFGVAQREALMHKGHYPHLLVMTATPIPRTLGLTLYGDLDISLLDQSPAGRGQVKTFVRTADRLPKVWEFVRQKLAEGRQAYVVYPLVEESEKVELKAVTREWEVLQKRLAPARVGLLHGRLRSADKEQVMDAFRRGEISVLLATTVIEVGVDVPNATVMLIENAEQFGLAQLHQLRGRIARSAHEAYCILIASERTNEAQQRLAVMEQTTDGFQIAEADMVLRGPGEFLGQKQSGLPPFRFGDLTKDRALIEKAREMAKSSV